MSKTYLSDPRGRKFLSAAAFIVTLVIIAALNILRLYVSEKFPAYMPDMDTVRRSLPERVLIALMLTLLALYVIFIMILLPMWYKTIRYVINNKEIISRTGLFSRTYRIMKLSAIQHASRISMPMANVTCFNFISVNALGGRMVLMFLSDKDCKEIMEMIGKKFEKKETDTSGKKYSVADPRDGSADHIYIDNADILSDKEIRDIIGDYSDYRQLSFADQQGAQLSFSDIEGSEDGGRGI